MKENEYERFRETERVRQLLISGLEGTYELEIEMGED